MRARWRIPITLIGVTILGGGLSVIGAASGSEGRAGAEPATPRVLEVYARSPVLVRSGERVLVPVRVVCATAAGDACSSSVTLGTRTGDATPWRLTTAPATGSLEFDLTNPTAGALARAAGKLAFFVEVRGPAGSMATLPSGGRAGPDDVFVAEDIPVALAARIPLGHMRRGRTILWLPWGSGGRRVGLMPGRESATLGPASFDVGDDGRVYLADSLQDRVAVFSHGRLIRQTPLAISARADIAVDAAGGVFVLDGRGQRVAVRRIDPSGAVGDAIDLGLGIPGQVRTLGQEAEVSIQPSDQWTALAATGGHLRPSRPVTGRPVADGRLLRVVAANSLRLATIRSDAVVDAVEVRFSTEVGEVALAEPDGSGGYWAVVHLRWDTPTPADRYLVVHVVAARVTECFAVRDARFAHTPPLAKFRLGPDGSLYQLMTTSRGVGIVRYPLGGES
jgi:hypothetical protein